MASVFFSHIPPQMSVLGVCEFGERVQNPTKVVNCFVAATNAHVQLCTAKTTVILSLKCRGRKNTQNYSIYSCFKSSVLLLKP